MVAMSSTSGRFSSVSARSLRSDAASRGSAAFFAPAMGHRALQRPAAAYPQSVHETAPAASPARRRVRIRFPAFPALASRALARLPLALAEVLTQRRRLPRETVVGRAPRSPRPRRCGGVVHRPATGHGPPPCAVAERYDIIGFSRAAVAQW